MELEFDSDFVEADEESLGTLARRNSKVNRGRNLKENVASDTVKPEMDRDFVISGGENSDINLAITSLENAANRTCERETKMNTNFASSYEESSSTLVLITSELNTGRTLKENEGSGTKTMLCNVEVGFDEVQNSEVKLGGKSFEAEQSQATTVGRHENKEYFSGGSSAYPVSMDPSNESAVLEDVPADSTQPKALLQPSVYYLEDKGLWKCRQCSWVYPGTNPGIELIEKHKEHCEGMNNDNMFFEHVFPIKHEFQKGSQINANLGRGSETIDYENKETEFVTSEMVSQNMTQKRNDQEWPTTEGIWQSYYTDSETSTGAYVTQSFVTGKFNQTENINNRKSAFLDSQIFPDTGSTATVRNGGPMSNDGQEKTENSGIKEHQHWNGVSKTVLQKSQDRFVGAKDEKQLRENQIRILEKNALEGEVEDIVKILKEQQSHDLICPNCGSCITKRVILRKRKRTSLVSEGNTDVQVAVSEEEHEITEDQSNRPEMSIEHGEETEAYGCLTCFSLFFIRGVKFFGGNNSSADQYTSKNLQYSRTLIEKEKDSFRCFSFLYPWGHSTPGDEADYAIETSLGKSGTQAESIPNTMPSESNLGMADTLHQKPATSIGSGSLLKNDGEKTTTVNVAGLDEDHTVAENVKLDPQMNGVKFFGGNNSSAEQYTSENLQDSRALIEKEKDSFRCFSFLYPWGHSTPDEQLKKPLLGLEDRQAVDKEAPVELGDESRSSLETLDPATLVQIKVGDSIGLNKVGDSVSQISEISPDSQNIVIPSDGKAATVINIVQTDDSQQENTGTSVSELSGRPKTEVTDLKVVTDWDLLKSVVYGGLTVSVTSLGIVSSAAGGEAKTLTVIAISLANLVAGFFLIITNILYLGRFHENEFKETVGHGFWFNGFIAILSYLIFGSLAPITYGFSFQKSDDTMYKFLAASLVSLISIILLALGKARVSKPENPGNPVKRYIQTVILYVVTGFWASFLGFFAGKYIKKLLEKWGFTSD